MQKKAMQPLKTYLGQYRSVVRQIESETEHIQRLRDRIDGGRSPNMSGMPRGHGFDLQDAIASLIDLENRVSARLKYLVTLRDDIERMISGVEDIQQNELMRYRYLDGMKWEDIAEKMHVELRTAYYIHGRALRAIRKAEEENEKR